MLLCIYTIGVAPKGAVKCRLPGMMPMMPNQADLAATATHSALDLTAGLHFWLGWGLACLHAGLLQQEVLNDTGCYANFTHRQRVLLLAWLEG